MFETLHCVALRTIKYADSRSILSAWSVERGYISFSMPAGNSRESVRRKALTMPLSTFEGICDIRPGRDIFFIKDIKPMKVGQAILNSPSKLAVALFLAEVFEKILRTSQRDDTLSAFVFDIISVLESAGQRATANLTLWALYRLTIPLGIEPDMNSWQPGADFDVHSACWRPSGLLNRDRDVSDINRGVRLLSRMTRGNLSRIALSRENRRDMLDGILRYYDIHFGKITPLTSLDVVRELF